MISDCAFIGSKISVLKIYQSLKEDYSHLENDLVSRLSSFNTKYNTTILLTNLLEAPSAQRYFTACVDAHNEGKFFESSDPCSKHRLLSCRDSHFLNGAPSRLQGTRFSDAEFQVAVNLRLGLPLFPYSYEGPCTLCNRDIHRDRFGFHDLSCVGLGTAISRHDSLKQLIFEELQSGNLCPRGEPLHLFDDSNKRVDLVVPNWYCGRSTAFDVSVTSPLQLSLKCSADSGGTAANARFEAKRSKFDDLWMNFAWKQT